MQISLALRILYVTLGSGTTRVRSIFMTFLTIHTMQSLLFMTVLRPAAPLRMPPLYGCLWLRVCCFQSRTFGSRVLFWKVLPLTWKASRIMTHNAFVSSTWLTGCRLFFHVMFLLTNDNKCYTCSFCIRPEPEGEPAIHVCNYSWDCFNCCWLSKLLFCSKQKSTVPASPKLCTSSKCWAHISVNHLLVPI